MKKEEEEEELFTEWPAEDEQQESTEEADEDDDEEQGTRRKSALDIPRPSHLPSNRRASLPCLTQLNVMTHLTRVTHLHSATTVPDPTPVRHHPESSEIRKSNRRSEDEEDGLNRIAAVPSLLDVPQRQVRFRSRNVMSLSDADSVCLICHDNLRRGGGSLRELHCSHSFHSECIDRWLWVKQICPTCHKHVTMPEPLYWTSTRVKVP